MSTRRAMSRKRSWGTTLRQKRWVALLMVIPQSTGSASFRRWAFPHPGNKPARGSPKGEVAPPGGVPGNLVVTMTGGCCRRPVGAQGCWIPAMPHTEENHPIPSRTGSCPTGHSRRCKRFYGDLTLDVNSISHINAKDAPWGPTLR